MKYRRFGRTELQMPVFSCGGMRYQQSWDDVAPEKVEEVGQRNLEATILRALELGINHIETARAYGSSEMQLGWILPRLPREKMIVQTKVAPFADPDEFRRTFEESMRYLKLERVDLLSFHGINNLELLDWTIRKGGCMEIAREFQRDGRCGHIGFSTHATTAEIVRAIETDEFDYVNLHWYFVNPLNWPAVQAATARDMGVFIISPSDKGGMLYDPPEKLMRLCAPLSPIGFNDLYCLARPEVHTLSIGAARPSDFEEHVAALEHYERAGEVTFEIAERLTRELNSVLGADWVENWAPGLPDYTQIPNEVNVQEILRLWTYAKGLDLTKWGKMRYNLMGNAGHWFPGSNAAAFDPTAIRGAFNDHRLADRIPAYRMSAPLPNHDQAQRSIRLALKKAGLNLDEVDYINAHGTSTPVGDVAETRALKAVFGERAYNGLLVSSTKSMLGHLLGAAGAVETAVCALTIKNGVIPPTINLENPAEECDLDYVANTAREKKVKVALNNSFGFGGHNVTLAVREFVG